MKLSLRMAGVVPFDAFWEQTFATALPPAGKYRPAAFCLHAGTKTVLAFPGSLRWLVSPFHKTESSFRRNLGAVTLGMGAALSIAPRDAIVDLHSEIASASDF